MARADKPKQATHRTSEAPKRRNAPLAASADTAKPADQIDALEAGGTDRSWRWYGTQAAAGDEGLVKGASGNKASAAPKRRTPRRNRAAPRPAPPRGRVPRA